MFVFTLVFVFTVLSFVAFIRVTRSDMPQGTKLFFQIVTIVIAIAHGGAFGILLMQDDRSAPLTQEGLARVMVKDLSTTTPGDLIAKKDGEILVVIQRYDKSENLMVKTLYGEIHARHWDHLAKETARVYKKEDGMAHYQIALLFLKNEQFPINQSARLNRRAFSFGQKAPNVSFL